MAGKPHKRHRATREEVEARRAALVAIVAEVQPATVRQVFYQATVAGIVEKSQAGYDKVQEDLVLLRRAGTVPWESIADNTRAPQQPQTFTDTGEAVRWLAAIYRKSLWADAECQLQVWLEKDALSGVLYPVTAQYDVPLMVSRGYSSVTFTKEAAESLQADGRPAFIFHLGDHDPSGVDAARAIEQELREHAGGLAIEFKRLAVLPAQTQAMSDSPTQMARPADRPSFLFNGVTNNSQQGAPVPLVFGRHLTGSVLVNSGVMVEDIAA